MQTSSYVNERFYIAYAYKEESVPPSNENPLRFRWMWRLSIILIAVALIMGAISLSFPRGEGPLIFISLYLIGKRRLEEAIKSTNLVNNVEIVFKAYQLDPNTPESSDESMLDNLATKYQISLDEAKNMLKNVAEQAKTVGLEYAIDDMKAANTFKAHRLAK